MQKHSATVTQYAVAAVIQSPDIIKLVKLGPPSSGEVVLLQIYISCRLLPLSVWLPSIASCNFPTLDDVKRRCRCRGEDVLHERSKLQNVKSRTQC